VGWREGAGCVGGGAEGGEGGEQQGLE
jgi:hypothetical protein